VYWVKTFPVKYDLVVAVCDEKLLDKSIKHGDIKIKISKHFYGGALVDEDIAIKFMKRATIVNLIGNDIVNIAEKNGFITKENIISINGTLHAQFVKL
jgi:hypothetical protein